MESVRIDKWLWAARFFKTRSMAAKAVSGGHVHLNGGRIKPARIVRKGDELRIRKGALTFVVTITAVADRRGPASAARLLYEESEQSIALREEAAERRRLVAMPAVKPDRRPDKRDRRKIREFIRTSSGGGKAHLLPR
ncbi:MAG: RNA-binding protein [Desulfobulbus propionicus]|nr:MAG: RNA-binding protein [Desulfobulbus propionicus]